MPVPVSTHALDPAGQLRMQRTQGTESTQRKGSCRPHTRPLENSCGSFDWLRKICARSQSCVVVVVGTFRDLHHGLCACLSTCACMLPGLGLLINQVKPASNYCLLQLLRSSVSLLPYLFRLTVLLVHVGAHVVLSCVVSC
jgi:hypothetical protein